MCKTWRLERDWGPDNFQNGEAETKRQASDEPYTSSGSVDARRVTNNAGCYLPSEDQSWRAPSTRRAPASCIHDAQRQSSRLILSHCPGLVCGRLQTWQTHRKIASAGVLSASNRSEGPLSVAHPHLSTAPSDGTQLVSCGPRHHRSRQLPMGTRTTGEAEGDSWRISTFSSSP